MRWTAHLIAAWILSGAAPVMAQSGANVTLQLPNFSTFGVQTTVVVPDSGPSPLARQRQARYSRATYGGFPRQGSIGIARGAAGLGVTAQVHDARSADESLLRAARARRANWVRGTTSASFGGDASLRSLAEIEHQRALERAADNSQARTLLERARRARSTGQAGVAAIYYGMAARRATGQLQDEIREEVDKQRAGSKPAE